MLQIDRRILTHFDFILPILIIPIIILSFYLINEANQALAHKQLIYFSIGAIIFSITFIIPIKKFDWIIPLFYWVSIILLFSVDFFGVTRLGARRWLEIPFINFTIQPSEVFKPAFLLMIAYLIKNNPPKSSGYGWKEFGKFSLYIILPFILIMKEPDLGTALILLLIGYSTLFVIGVNKKIWIILGISIIISAPLLYSNLHGYQKKRITNFLGNKKSYHVRQSIIAIGSGGLKGKSRQEATQTHLKFLPVSTSDFIFAYFTERFGFLGALGLLSLYTLLVIHLMSFSFKFKKNYFLRSMVISTSFMIFIYMSINVAMTIALAPVVGVPLPFFSYGGSSFITFMVIFGIIENLISFQYDTMYSKIKYR